MTATPPRADPVREGERIRAEIAAHPRAVLIDALADTMHAIEDDMGTGRHINDYLCLAYATVEMLPSLVYDENSTCDEPGCGAHPATQVTVIGDDAAAAPPPGLSATGWAETAPAVPEEAGGQRVGEGVDPPRDDLDDPGIRAAIAEAAISKGCGGSSAAPRTSRRTRPTPPRAQPKTSCGYTMVPARARTALSSCPTPAPTRRRTTMGDRTDDLREALYFALSSDYEIESADYRRAAGLLVHLGYVPLADVLDALRDHDGFVDWTRTKGPQGYIDDYVIRQYREACARYLAERFAPTTAPQGADERNGHG
jgi:hypothetical protein